MNIDGTNRVNLTPNTQLTFEDAASMSPDGLKIAFHGYYNNTPGIYVMNSDGSNLHLVIANGMKRPSWSPDSQKLAFEYEYQSADQIATINIDGSGFSLLTNSF